MSDVVPNPQFPLINSPKATCRPLPLGLSKRGATDRGRSATGSSLTCYEHTFMCYTCQLGCFVLGEWAPAITNSSVTIRTHANTGFPSAALAYSKAPTWMPWLSLSVDLAIGCCFAIGSRADRCLYRSFLSMGVLFGRQVPHYSVLAGMGNAPC